MGVKAKSQKKPSKRRKKSSDLLPRSHSAGEQSAQQYDQKNAEPTISNNDVITIAGTVSLLDYLQALEQSPPTSQLALEGDLGSGGLEPNFEQVAEPAVESHSASPVSESDSDLNQQWQRAITTPSHSLPQQSELEAKLGTSLDHVEVHEGPVARSLLSHLNARAATRGRHIVVPSLAVDALTLAHEVIHTLQSSDQKTQSDPAENKSDEDHFLQGDSLQGDRNTNESAENDLLLAADDPCEQEAESLAHRLTSSSRQTVIPVAQAFNHNPIALRRSTLSSDISSPLEPADLADLSETAATLPPLGLEDLDHDPAGDAEPSAESSIASGISNTPRDAEETSPVAPGLAPSRRRAASRSDLSPELEETTEDASSTARRQPDRAQQPLNPVSAQTPAPDADTRAVQLPPVTVNRREQVATLLTSTQDLWDNSARAAERHQVSPCTENATASGMAPFSRGEPLAVPDTEAQVDLTNPERPDADREALSQAENLVERQLGQVPNNRRAPHPGTLEADLEAERTRQRRAVDTEIAAVYNEQSIDTLDTPTVDLTETADLARAQTDQQALDNQATTQLNEQRLLALADQGEGQMAPESDPTIGHDTELNELEIPQISLETMMEDVDLNRIATEENLGQVEIDQLVVVQDADFDTTQMAAEAEEESQALIEQNLTASDRTLNQRCREAMGDRTAQQQAAEREVGQRQTNWETDISGHVAQQSEAGKDLVTEKLEHVDRIKREADAEAQAAVEEAQSEADAQWEETQERANQKAEESEDQSWWSRGIDFVTDQIERLVSWIEDFIDACKEVIDSLLDVASAFAHAVVNAAHATITGTLDLLRDGLDIIANNLPGELGEIAQGYRDDLFDYLDEIQEDVDQWANDLHTDIDKTIEDLRTTLHGLLDDFAAGVRAFGEMVKDFFQEGLLALVKRVFPTLGELIEKGLDWAIDWAAEKLEDWLTFVMDVTGLQNLEQTLTELYDERFCQEETPEERAQACAEFERQVEALLGWFDVLMQSPMAQRLQAMLQASRDEQAEEQLGALDNFFSFISVAATTVKGWWDSLSEIVGEVVDFFGEIAATVWHHIATALDIDVNLDPLEALAEGLNALWQEIVEAASSVLDPLREAWRWLKEESFLSPVFEFFASIGELWDALSQLWNKITTSVGDWLAEAAEWLSETLFPWFERIFQKAGRALNRGIDRLAEFANGLIEQIDALLNWEATLESLNRLLAVLRKLAAPMRAILRAFSDCLIMALRWVANVVGNLLHYARVFLDITVGIVQAILFIPIGTVGFLAGAAWLYLVPECYKGPILNFILDVFIRFIEFIPQPADFMFAALYQGALSFFRTLREAPDQKKIDAMNLFASIFAGNAEVAAGFAVGLLEGVWESTGGTVIFLLKIVGWLLMLPVKLIQWAAGVMSGESSETADAGTTGTESAGTTAPESASEEATGDNISAAAVPETTTQAEVETEQIATSAQTTETDVDTAAFGNETTSADASSETSTAESVPETPPELSQLGESFQRMINEGFTRDDLQQLLDGMRQTLTTMVGKLAEDAAKALLNALTTEGSAFKIGRVMGMVVGMVVVEVLLALFSGGASAGVTAAKVALQGARGTAKLASVVRKLRKAVQPLLDMVKQLRRALQPLVNRVKGWLDNVLAWIRNIFRRAGGGVRRSRRPRPVPRSAGRPGPRIDAPTGPRRPRQVPRRPRGDAPTPRRPRSVGPRQPARPRTPDRPRRPRRRPQRGSLRFVAERAARTAWLRATPQARRRVINARSMRNLLRRTPVARPPGVRVSITIDHQGRDLWRVRASARKGVRRATQHHGRGWRARGERRDWWYTTAGDQDRVHRRVVDNLTSNLNNRAQRILENEPDPRQIHRRLVPDIQQFERRPRPNLLQGIRLSINENQFREGRNRRNREVLKYRYTIQPNSSEGEIEAAVLPRRMSQNPTYVLRHHLLRTASPTIRNLGPYQLNPNNVGTPGQSPFFQVRPSRGWASDRMRRQRWRACVNQTDYTLEKYRWNEGRNQFVRGDASIQSMVTDRVRRMRTYVRHPNVNTPPAFIAQPEVNAILSHNQGRSPRPMSNSLVEDGRESTSHFLERHILGTAPGIQHPHELAVRAVFKHIPGTSGWVPLPNSSSTASAFSSLSVSNRALSRLHGRLRQAWLTERDAIIQALDTSSFQTHSVFLPLSGLSYTSVKKQTGASPSSGLPPGAPNGSNVPYKLPAYRYASSGGIGVRVLTNQDLLSGAWLTWSSNNSSLANPSPMTMVNTLSRVVFRIHPSASHQGWFIVTMFPSI